jgi:hypothetical protein
VLFCVTSIAYIMSVNFDLMEKDELQRLCVELFKQFEDLKISIIDHLQRLKDFELKRM